MQRAYGLSHLNVKVGLCLTCRSLFDDPADDEMVVLGDEWEGAKDDL